MTYIVNAEAMLERLPIFCSLDAIRITRLAQACRQVRVEKNGFAFRRGDAADGLYIVTSGHVKLAIPSTDGHEKVLDFFGPGQVFGEAVMFLSLPYMVDAQALDDTLLLWIDKSEIFDAIDEDSAFARRMLASLSLGLHSLMQDIEAVSLQSAAQRLATYLLNQPRDGGRTRFPFSKSIVASKLGLSPETLSRLLNQMSSAGLISVQGRVVTIHQLDGMRLQQVLA